METIASCATAPIVQWLAAVGGVVGLGLIVQARAGRRVGPALAALAAALGGRVQRARGLRPCVVGVHRGAIVVVDFPARAAAPGAPATIWARARRTVPGTLRARVRADRAAEDLLALGVDRAALGRLAAPLAALFGDPAGRADLVIERGVARVQVPVTWSAAGITGEGLLALVEHGRALADAVLAAHAVAPTLERAPTPPLRGTVHATAARAAR